jgi:predicted ribosome quality control (RQC) complex YloA/Tae2 family protein
VVESIRRDKESGRLLLILGSRRGKRYLIIGARGPQAAFFWTHGKSVLHAFERYGASEALNRLRGARLHSLTIPQADRWARLEFTKPPKEDGAAQAFSLAITWTGAAGNVRLLDAETDKVLETVGPEDESTVGIRFTPPQPPPLIDWRSLTFPLFLKYRRQTEQQTLADWLLRKVWGIDSAIADQITGRVGEAETDVSTAVSAQENWRQFATVMQTLRAAIDPATAILLDTVKPRIAEITLGDTGPEDEADGQRQSLAYALARIDQHQTSGEQSASLRGRVSDAVTKRASKARRRLTAVQKAAGREADHERMQRAADMLAAQRHLLRKGMESITLPDWDTGAETKIKLDPAKTPQENIDNSYRRARTTANAIKNAQAEIASLAADSERWDQIAKETGDPETGDDRLSEIAAECGISSTDQKKRGGPARRIPYREFLLGETQLWVGRSRRDNDELTLHHARPYDLFFHAQGCPGSHVILRCRDRNSRPEQHLITTAAEIAAYFSKAKHSSLVPVSYTEIRYVRKPRKAPAGLVRLEREETVMVAPKPPPGYHEAG